MDDIEEEAYEEEFEQEVSATYGQPQYVQETETQYTEEAEISGEPEFEE